MNMNSVFIAVLKIFTSQNWDGFSESADPRYQWVRQA